MGLVESKRPVVLIVEDEFLFRMDAVDMIAAAGFEVVEAANADEAIEILQSRHDITVVFTDIQMPGSMDGLKLARAVRGRWPPIKIVATSGRLDVSETDSPRRRAVSGETLQSGAGYRCAARADRRRVNFDTSSRGANEMSETGNLEIPRRANVHLRSGPSDHPGMT